MNIAKGALSLRQIVDLPLRAPSLVRSLHPRGRLTAPFVQLVFVLLWRTLSKTRIPSQQSLTDERMYGLLCLSFQAGKLLLHLPFEIPVWPFRGNVEHVLGKWSVVHCCI
jgi:hypothetical protein